jgi:hypothetical protein
MAASNNDQTVIRDYLLGKLSDEEQQKIEERLMVEDDLFQELEISKGELIDEYCAGDLNKNEHHWFERHYLASTEGNERRAFVVALESIERPKPARQSVSWFDRLRAFFTPPVIGIATAGVILVVVVALINRSTGSQNSLAVTLANSTIKRSTTEAQYHKIALGPDIDELRLSLTLPASAGPAPKYRAELDNRYETKTLTQAAPDGNSVLVVIPAEALPAGIYAVTLFAIQADGSEQAVPGQYFFEVERSNG